MKIVTIVGARPQFIKAAVVSRAIAEHNELVGHNHSLITEVILHTGQHYDWNMSDVFFEEMHIPRPDYFLDIHCMTHGAMTGRMLEKIEEILVKENPDFVLVYGDTNTTLAGALAAVKLHFPIAHVEAGLRSFNRRMPEEINRILTDQVSTILFCPTDRSVENLRAEGIPRTANGKFNQKRQQKVALVGDTMLDAALYYKKFAKKPNHNLFEPFILATLHRQENTDDQGRLESIFEAFNRISRKIPVLLPLHPRTKKKLQDSEIINIKSHQNLRIVEPLSYLEMIFLIKRCNLIITDSGGLQKEAYFFGKPCVTLRDETEWVELVEHGFNMVSGTDAKHVYEAFQTMASKKIDVDLNFYGEGNAGSKIVNILTV